jgi:hypothetical protein
MYFSGHVEYHEERAQPQQQHANGPRHTGSSRTSASSP